MKKKNIIDESVIIIDDAIPEEEQHRIENFCSNQNINWSYQAKSTYKPDYEKINALQKAGWLNNTYEPPQFVHTLMDASKGLPGFNSPAFNHFISVYSAIPVKFINFARVKINYVHPVACPEGSYSPPHVDFTDAPLGTKIVLYYVNDSDGDTIIFNQTAKDFNKSVIDTPLTIKAKISPKRGRMVIFDGDLVHSAGIPTKHNNRIVVNINLYQPYSDKSLITLK